MKRRRMQLRRRSLVRSEQIHDGQIEVESFAAHHYLLTPMPVEVNPMRNMQQIMQHLQSAWEHSSYKAGCGSYISLEKALQGQFDASGFPILYMRQNDKTNGQQSH